MQTGHWKAGHSSAESYSKKIHLLDQMVDAEDWDELVGFSPPNPNNSYQKAVGVAWKKGLQELGAKLGKSPDEIAAALSGASKKPAIVTDADVKPVIKVEDKLPPAPPASALSPVDAAELSSWKKTGDSLGTAPGGQYEDAAGNRYYVKQHKNPAQAAGEVLAARLYGAAGTPTLNYKALVKDGQTVGTVTPWEKAEKVDWNDPKSRQAAQAFFAVHAWLANWDAIGAGSENPMDNQRFVNGTMTTLDVGGALTFSGLGANKPFTPSGDEFDSMRNPKINPSCAKVFGEMSAEQLYESSKLLWNIKDADIKKIVDENWGSGIGDGLDKDTLVNLLMSRRDAIVKKAADLKAGASVVKPAEPKPEAKPKPKPQPVDSSATAAGAKYDAVKAAMIEAGISGWAQYVNEAAEAEDPVAWMKHNASAPWTSVALKEKLAVAVDKYAAAQKKNEPASSPAAADDDVDPNDLQEKSLQEMWSVLEGHGISFTDSQKGQMEADFSALDDSVGGVDPVDFFEQFAEIAKDAATEPEEHEYAAKLAESAAQVAKLKGGGFVGLPATVASLKEMSMSDVVDLLKKNGVEIDFESADMAESVWGDMQEDGGLSGEVDSAVDFILKVVPGMAEEDPEIDQWTWKKAAEKLKQIEAKITSNASGVPSKAVSVTGNEAIDAALNSVGLTAENLSTAKTTFKEMESSGEPYNVADLFTKMSLWYGTVKGDVETGKKFSDASEKWKASQGGSAGGVSPSQTPAPKMEPLLETVPVGGSKLPVKPYAEADYDSVINAMMSAKTSGNMTEYGKTMAKWAVETGNPAEFFAKVSNLAHEMSPDWQVTKQLTKIATGGLPAGEPLPDTGMKWGTVAALQIASGLDPTYSDIAAAVVKGDPDLALHPANDHQKKVGSKIAASGFPKVSDQELSDVVSKYAKQNGIEHLASTTVGNLQYIANQKHGGDVFAALGEYAVKNFADDKLVTTIYDSIKDLADPVSSGDAGSQSLKGTPPSVLKPGVPPPNSAAKTETPAAPAAPAAPEIESVAMPAAIPQPPTVSWGGSNVAVQAKNKLAALYNAAANGGLPALEAVKLAFHKNSYGKVIHAYKAKLVEALNAGAVATVKHVPVLKKGDIAADVMKDTPSTGPAPVAPPSPAAIVQTPEAAQVGQQIHDKMVSAGFAPGGYFADLIKNAADPQAEFAKLMAAAPHSYASKFAAAKAAISGIPAVKPSKTAAPALKPLTISDLPSAPVFQTSNLANKAVNEQAIAEITGLATGLVTSDANAILQKLQALPPSASPKVEAYKQQVITAFKDQHKPKPTYGSPASPTEVPAVSSGSTNFKSWSKKVLDEVAAAKPMNKQALKGYIPPASSVKTHVGQKIASYLVLGQPEYDPGIPERKHTSPAERSVMISQAKQEYQALDPTTRKAMKDYTNSWYHSANDHLRAGTETPAIKQIGTLYTKAVKELPVGTHVGRGLTLPNPKALMASVGKVVQEPGFTSTCLNGEECFGGNVRWEITTGPGARAMFAAAWSSHSEEEILWPPNQRFFVHKVQEDKNGSVTVFATALPTTDDQCCQ